MINNENQFFYLAIVGQNLHIDYFESKDSNSSYQKNYPMPDTLDDNLNLIVLSKFVLEKVKDFEKEVIPVPLTAGPREPVFKALYDSIRLGKDPVQTGHWCLGTLQVCHAVLDSAKRREPVFI